VPTNLLRRSLLNLELFLMVFIGKPRSETKGGWGNRIILRSKPD
jgi:hypothetical protein